MARPARTPVSLPIDAIMAFDGNEITEHNRSTVSIDYEPLQEQNRMIRGTMRRYYVGVKRKWSFSYDDLFSRSEFLFDGYWGGEEIKDFYNSLEGDPFTLTITFGDGSNEDVLVMFDEFNFDVTKRTTDFDFWDMSITLVEV